MNTNTIFALSSGTGRAGVAIIRVSGSQAFEAGKNLSGLDLEPRVATLAKLHDAHGALLDHAVLIAFPAPKSFTGENVLEIHCHGSPAVIAAILKTLGEYDGCRAAEAGEFTRRAFINGKMDLTEIEGLSDLLNADTDLQRRAALKDTIGASRALYTQWRAALMEARALVEALIDFSAEEDIPDTALDGAKQNLEMLLKDVTAHLGAARASEQLRDGLTVVIAGAPNSGKSSLLNALARRDVAIVTAEAGTTRDILEVRLDLDGAPVTLIDTAGLRETDNPVEQEGIRRALARAKSADLVLLLSAQDADAVNVEDFSETLCWKIASKADLGHSGAHDLALSVATGEGITELVHRLSNFAANAFNAGDEQAVFIRERHRQLLQHMQDQLHTTLLHFRALPLEILAEELRHACLPLERIMGYVDADEMLGVIFSRFCIGK